MNKDRFRNLRQEMHYSMADLSVLIGVPKTTLQRYEDGSAKVPVSVAVKLIEAHRRDKSWMKQLLRKIDKDVRQRFPAGIISEVQRGLE